LELINSNITKHLPKITHDYINDEEYMGCFFNRKNNLENYYDQILEKNNNYNNDFRKTLAEVLKSNYNRISKNSDQLESIKKLKKNNTYTITTGHQLNLFTGPLYFFYKIIDSINICKELKSKYPENEFIPVYWMASEDHDFKEINHFKTNDVLFNWNVSTKGTVGELKTDSLDKIFNQIIDFFGKNNSYAKNIIELFKESYLKNEKISDATFNLVHSLFGKYGLLILNPDDGKLKKIICEDIIHEIKNIDCYKRVTETNKKINNLNIKPQVNPREINLFYVKNNIRSRIEKYKSSYKVKDTDILFSENEIISEINNFPERFSPNVLLRPLFQEKILPNLAYIGGGSEIAYWLQLKSFFNYKDLTFPILVVRNSVLLVSNKILNKCKKLDIRISDLFLNNHELSKFYLTKISELKIDLTELKETVKSNFIKLHELSLKTDKSFLGALKAQEKKQLNGLNNLEKKLFKAQKKKYNEKLERLILIKEELFPNNSLQERQINFSEFYRNHGDEFIDVLIDNLNPFDNKFLVISL
tara:strand:+ start:638 stop:2230 length:1593 start_codon:yes stop_codon:yes gene_type:complete